MKRHLIVQKWCEHVVCLTFWPRSVLRATTACTFSTRQLPTVVRCWCALRILTWNCASRHNCVHFFDISTSKSGLNMVCFVHFDVECGNLGFMSPLAWLEWRPLKGAQGHKLCSLNWKEDKKPHCIHMLARRWCEDDPRFRAGRIPAEDISPAPTPLPLATQLWCPEPVPHSLRWGTRDSLLRGSQRLGAALAAAEKREVPLEGFAFQAKALCDLWGTLADRDCYVIRDGKALVGKALGVTGESSRQPRAYLEGSVAKHLRVLA